MHFRFEYPIFLLLLLLLICFVKCKKVSKPFYIPKLEWISSSSPLSNLFTYLKMLVFSLFVFSLASPFVYSSISAQPRSGRAIVLALDASGSMNEVADSGKSKFEIVQSLSKDFINKRASDNIGIVVFGTFAFSASGVTYDHQSLKELLDMLEVEIAGKNTAIADALHQSIRSLSFSKAKEKIVILITDGINNSGSISINDAIKEAKKEKVKVYTIGIGDSKDYDRALLDHISSATFAKTFQAKDISDLKDIYSEIDSLNPSKIRSENYINKKALFIYPLFLGFLITLYLLAKEEGVV